MNSKMDRSIITYKRYTLTNSQGNTYLFAHSATAMYRLAVQVFHKKTALLIICLFVFSLFSSVSLQSTSETLDEARYGAVNPPGTWDSSNIEFAGPNECRKFSDYFEGTAPNGFTRLTDAGEVAANLLASCLVSSSDYDNLNLSDIQFTISNPGLTNDQILQISWLESVSEDGESVYGSDARTFTPADVQIKCTDSVAEYACLDNNNNITMKPDATVEITCKCTASELDAQRYLNDDGDSVSLIISPEGHNNLMITVQSHLENDPLENLLIKTLGYSTDVLSLVPFKLTPGSYLNAPLAINVVNGDETGCFWISLEHSLDNSVSEFDFGIQRLINENDTFSGTSESIAYCADEFDIGAVPINTLGGAFPTMEIGLFATKVAKAGVYSVKANFVDSSNKSVSKALFEVEIVNDMPVATNIASEDIQFWIGEKELYRYGESYCKSDNRWISYSESSDICDTDGQTAGRAHGYSGDFHYYTLPGQDDTLEPLPEDDDCCVIADPPGSGGAGGSSGPVVTVGQDSYFTPDIQIDLGDSGVTDVIIFAKERGTNMKLTTGYSILNTQSSSDLETIIDSFAEIQTEGRAEANTGYYLSPQGFLSEHTINDEIIRGLGTVKCATCASSEVSDANEKVTLLLPGYDYAAPYMSTSAQSVSGLLSPTSIQLVEGVDLVITFSQLQNILGAGEYELEVLTGQEVDSSEFMGYAQRSNTNSSNGFMSSPWSRASMEFSVLPKASPDVYLTGGGSDCWDDKLMLCTIEIPQGAATDTIVDIIDIIVKNPTSNSPYLAQVEVLFSTNTDLSANILIPSNSNSQTVPGVVRVVEEICPSKLDLDDDGLDDIYCLDATDGSASSLQIDVYTPEYLSFWNGSSIQTTGPVWDDTRSGNPQFGSQQVAYLEGGKTSLRWLDLDSGNVNFLPLILPESNLGVDQHVMGSIDGLVDSATVVPVGGTMIGSFDVSTLNYHLENGEVGDEFKIKVRPNVESCEDGQPCSNFITINYVVVESIQVDSNSEIAALNALAILVLVTIIGSTFAAQSGGFGMKEKEFNPDSTTECPMLREYESSSEEE